MSCDRVTRYDKNVFYYPSIRDNDSRILKVAKTEIASLKQALYYVFYQICSKHLMNNFKLRESNAYISLHKLRIKAEKLLYIFCAL